MRFIFAGGGTGGHLFPGIALAQKAVQRHPDVTLLFYCTPREFDAAQLRKYSFSYRVMPVPRLTRRPTVPAVLVYAIVRTAFQLRRDRADAVLGLGGYGALPALAAARLMGIPCALLEQNVLPGKVNRLASLWAHRIYSQWCETKKYFCGSAGKFRFTGSPLRESIRHLNPAEARKSLGLDPDRMTLTILGGSQGAQALNAMMIREAPLLGHMKDKIQILHLTGSRGVTDLTQGYARAGIAARVIDFTDRMDAVLSASDVIVSRAGGMAISEAAFFGMPALYVPYPFAAEDHQMRNARVLERSGAAWVIPEKNLTAGCVKAIVDKYFSSRDEFAERARRLRQFARPDAAEIILDDLLTIARGPR